MTLVAGSPVPDDEVWFRVLVNRRHLTREGTLHANALKGSAFTRSSFPGAAYELSGRLRSLAGTAAQLVTDGVTRAEGARQSFRDRGQPVPSDLEFCGIATAECRSLKFASIGTSRTAVIYTPISAPNPDEDIAHADLVIIGPPDDIVLADVRTRLRVILQVSRPQDTVSV